MSGSSTGCTSSRILPETIRDTSSTSSTICVSHVALRSSVSRPRAALSPRQDAAAQQPRVADDRVERRAQLVREHGEELVLHAVRRLRVRVQPGVLQRDRGPRGHAQRQPLVLLGEHADLRMAEEQAAEHIARDALHRHRQIAAHRQVAWRHSVVRRALSVSRILRHVVQPHRAFAVKGRGEDRRRARMRKLRERFPRRAGQRVQHVRVARLRDRSRCRRRRRTPRCVSSVATSVTFWTIASRSSVDATTAPTSLSFSVLAACSRAVG